MPYRTKQNLILFVKPVRNNFLFFFQVFLLFAAFLALAVAAPKPEEIPYATPIRPRELSVLPGIHPFDYSDFSSPLLVKSVYEHPKFDGTPYTF